MAYQAPCTPQPQAIDSSQATGKRTPKNPTSVKISGQRVSPAPRGAGQDHHESERQDGQRHDTQQRSRHGSHGVLLWTEKQVDQRLGLKVEHGGGREHQPAATGRCRDDAVDCPAAVACAQELARQSAGGHLEGGARQIGERFEPDGHAVRGHGQGSQVIDQCQKEELATNDRQHVDATGQTDARNPPSQRNIEPEPAPLELQSATTVKQNG